MAITVCVMRSYNVGRTTAAREVVAYYTRSGAEAPEPSLAQMLGVSQATGWHDDLVHQEVCNMPWWAKDDAGRFFATAQRLERVNGRWARSWMMALPRELDQEAQIALARDFLATHLANLPYLWVMHDPVNARGEHQPHFHVLFHERLLDGIDRSADQHFMRWNAAYPDRGGAQKDAWFCQRSTAYEIRAAWCDWVNYSLEREGHAERLHPDSLYARGFRGPTEPKHVSTRHRLTIQAQRDPQAEQRQAAEAWEIRKQRVGIADVQTTPPAAFLEQSRNHARREMQHQWEGGARQEPIWTHIPGLKRDADALGTGLRMKLYEKEQYEQAVSLTP